MNATSNLSTALLHPWQTSLMDHNIPTEWRLGLGDFLNTVLLAANTNQWHLASEWNLFNIADINYYL